MDGDWLADAITKLVDASNQWHIGDMEERVREALRILVDHRRLSPDGSCQHVNWRGHCYLCGMHEGNQEEAATYDRLAQTEALP